MGYLERENRDKTDSFGENDQDQEETQRVHALSIRYREESFGTSLLLAHYDDSRGRISSAKKKCGDGERSFYLWGGETRVCDA